jgi:prevent-host-death family protein
MTTVASDDAQAHLPQLLEQVANGQKIVITDRGKPVAMLVPPPPAQAEDVQGVIEAFKAYSKRQGRTLGALTAREMIEEGRRY